MVSDGGTKNRPLSPRTEGVEITRYHLWFAVASQQQPHSVQQRFSLFRANPSFPTMISGKPLREVFGHRSLLPRTGRQFSESDLDTYFIPSTRWQYPNKFPVICQAFKEFCIYYVFFYRLKPARRFLLYMQCQLKYCKLP